mmetsp:Transcript_18549/g.33571  ORF Transcript_18549/g.33571 Transcript_18549/m.33571 type:complete len:80 (-) Transcript_18549:306-545(-)
MPTSIMTWSVQARHSVCEIAAKCHSVRGTQRALHAAPPSLWALHVSLSLTTMFHLFLTGPARPDTCQSKRHRPQAEGRD